MATASVVSNEGALASASAVLLIVASNEDYNQPGTCARSASNGDRRDGVTHARDDASPSTEQIALRWTCVIHRMSA
jgi:hypothetical protein